MPTPQRTWSCWRRPPTPRLQPAFVFCFATLALLSSGSVLSAAESKYIRVPAGGSALAQGDTAGCGPVSLLNMLKLGPKDFRAAYAKISGGQDKRALSLLAEKFCSSTGAGGKVRYSNDTGINDSNLTKLCERVFKNHELGPLHTLYANRRRGESNRELARRVNRAIVHSIQRGVPVIMSVDSYGVRKKKWVKLTGHYMLITGVQTMGPHNPGSFVIEYVDPVGGEKGQAFCYASTRRNSRAIAHFPEGDKWLEGNPYLYLAVPGKNLAESRQPWDSRHEFFLTILFGRLK